MTPLIRLNEVGVCFRLKRRIHNSRDYWALKNVSMDIHRGETLGVFGSNGAGKSTLMKLIAGILAPDRGTITRERDLTVTLLSLGVGFESNLTGRENAIMSGMLLGLHRQTIERRLGRIHEFSELGEFFDQPVFTYSTGMMARLGFSVALEVDPDVLLLDEVLSVGDAAFQQKSESVIVSRIRSDKTVVVISHDFNFISQICDRAVWIDHGCSLASGTVEEVALAAARTDPLPIGEREEETSAAQA